VVSLKALILGAAIFLAACGGLRAAAPDGKIHLSYWEKWSGAEQLAMQEVVDQFNRSQDRIVVDFLSVGQIEQKTLLATAGGDPPDISGIFLDDICAFADRNALSPLGHFIREDGSTPEQFLSRYARAYSGMGSYEGEIWGVPSTPTTVALYWNKDLFRAAGLDPERPPRTIAELVAMSDKLTVYDAAGQLVQVGFLPQQDSGWIFGFPQWFGGQLFDGRNITIGTDPANLTAYQWVEGFSTKYGVANIRRLTSSFGSLSTPDDPFNNGKVAILLDGVWRYNYIQQFAPGLSYGITGWPEAVPGVDDFTIAESDMLVIPRGAKHPREAWEFLKFVSSPNLAAQSLDQLSGVELLCYYQMKASPLTQWSPYFAAHHPNPYIGIFRHLAESPHAITAPKIGIWDEYFRHLNLAFDQVRLELATPRQALQDCQARVEQSWHWHQQSLARRHALPGAPLTSGQSVAPSP